MDISLRLEKEIMKIEDVQRADMKKWLSATFNKYNESLQYMAKVNIRDDDISKEWKKIDKAIDNISRIANKKGYFK